MRHRLKYQRIFIEDDPSVNILFEKYKLLRSEAIENSARNNRQVAYIQVYGIFLFTLTGIFFGFTDAVNLSYVPNHFRLPVLVLSAALLFYYYSQIYLSSFKFRVLRLRMAEIETSINKLAGRNLLRYEKEIAPTFFGNLSLKGQYFLPNTWLQGFTFILFLVAIYVLIILSVNLLSGYPGWTIFYIGSLMFFGVTLVWENLRLSLPGSISIDLDGSDLPDTLTIGLRLSRYGLNYFVVILITYVALFDQFGDPFSSFTTGFIKDFMASVSASSENVVLLWVAGYTAACGIFLPTPSELPLALSSQISVAKIVLVSAIGKSIGSLILYFASVAFCRVNDHDPKRWQSYIESGIVGKLLSRTRVSFVYALLQSIPFAPMRSATFAYAVVAPPSRNSVIAVVVGSFLGTISRMLIIGFLIATGIYIIPSLATLP